MMKKKARKAKTQGKVLHQWVCPEEGVFMLKAEAILVVVFFFLVFAFSLGVFEGQWLPTLIGSLLFVLIFFIVNYVSGKIYPIQEVYYLTQEGVNIERRTGKRIRKFFVKYGEIDKFKLDKLMHGGRLETGKKKHPLFFNTIQEIEKLEEILKKKVKGKK